MAAHCRRLGHAPYPDNLIQEGEEVALDLRPHWWFFAKHILTGIPLLFLLFVSCERRQRHRLVVLGLVVGLVPPLGRLARSPVPELDLHALRRHQPTA